VHKKVKAFYDMANEYSIAAASLWISIVDVPYLYNNCKLEQFVKLATADKRTPYCFKNGFLKIKE